jgi:SAM-dependent methyltransferase
MSMRDRSKNATRNPTVFNDAMIPQPEVVQPHVRMQLLQMGSAYLLSRALHVAAELGIADYLSRGDKTAAELAVAINCEPEAVYRLLRMLAANGVFAEDGAGRFSLTPLGSALRSDVSGSLRDAIRMIDDTWWNVYGQLAHSVRTGQPAFEYVTGCEQFKFQELHPDVNERFARGMANFSDHENRSLAAAYDFSRYTRIVDVGGGRGGFIAEVLNAYPATKGVLYDRADVLEHATYVMAAGVQDRCEFVGGDFFMSVPPAGDMYVMKRIIHDWNDDRSTLILRNCKAAMRPDGRIVVIDAVVPAGNEWHPAKMSDLLMLALLGGRERTAAEFRSLFRAAGLKLTKIISTPTMLSILEGVAR